MGRLGSSESKSDIGGNILTGTLQGKTSDNYTSSCVVL